MRQMSVKITVSLEEGGFEEQEVLNSRHYHLQGSFPTEKEFVDACTRNASRIWELLKDTRTRTLGPIRPKPKPGDLNWGEIKIK